MAMHNELWFPNVIWSSMIHSVKNSDIKKFAYDLQKTESGRKVSNQLGWQSRDIKPGENSGIDQLIKVVDEEMSICAKQVGLKPVQLYNIWININPIGAYNELHNHQNAIFSGVYYVDSTIEQGNIQFERGDNADYHVPTEAIEQITYYTSSRATYAAKTGGLLIFPGWLKHSVQANRINQDRISVSFNYGLKT